MESAAVREDEVETSNYNEQGATADLCLICHEPLVFDMTVIANCGHVYHTACINTWLNTQYPGGCCVCDVRGRNTQMLQVTKLHFDGRGLVELADKALQTQVGQLKAELVESQNSTKDLLNELINTSQNQSLELDSLSQDFAVSRQNLADYIKQANTERQENLKVRLKLTQTEEVLKQREAKIVKLEASLVHACTERDSVRKEKETVTMLLECFLQMDSKLKRYEEERNSYTSEIVKLQSKLEELQSNKVKPEATSQKPQFCTSSSSNDDIIRPEVPPISTPVSVDPILKQPEAAIVAGSASISTNNRNVPTRTQLVTTVEPVKAASIWLPKLIDPAVPKTPIETTNPPAQSTAPPPDDDIFAKFRLKKDQWKCGTCYVFNLKSSNVCVSCETPNTIGTALGASKPITPKKVATNPAPSEHVLTGNRAVQTEQPPKGDKPFMFSNAAEAGSQSATALKNVFSFANTRSEEKTGGPLFSFGKKESAGPIFGGSASTASKSAFNFGNTDSESITSELKTTDFTSLRAANSITSTLFTSDSTTKCGNVDPQQPLNTSMFGTTGQSTPSTPPLRQGFSIGLAGGTKKNAKRPAGVRS